MIKIPQRTHALSDPFAFAFNPRILAFIARLILALLNKRSVNLFVLGNILNPSTKSESNQRRATRFLTLNMHLTGRDVSALETKHGVTHSEGGCSASSPTTSRSP
jgi:hypothetical protein